MSALLAAAVAITLTGIHDGDTVRAGAERIRLEAIDSPEVRGSPACTAAKRGSHDCDFPAGERSRAALMTLLAGRQVTIERHGLDRYGRTIGRLYADGIDVSCWMVSHRFAVERYGRLDCER